MTEPTPLSPEAQSVLNAATNRWHEVDDDIPAQVAAAALCAAADHMPDHQLSAHMLYAIAAELDPTTEAP